MTEDRFVGTMERVIAGLLPKKLEVMRGAALLYEIKVDNRLEFTVKPSAPVRGQSAFQTDLCIFERLGKSLRIPRVVLEFKASVTTHDLLTYSAKARKHKHIYPYLRYGLVASKDAVVPSKFYTHNEALDFMLAAGGVARRAAGAAMRALIRQEIATSRSMEALIFGDRPALLVRSALQRTHAV